MVIDIPHRPFANVTKVCLLCFSRWSILEQCQPNGTKLHVKETNTDFLIVSTVVHEPLSRNGTSGSAWGLLLIDGSGVFPFSSVANPLSVSKILNLCPNSGRRDRYTPPKYADNDDQFFVSVDQAYTSLPLSSRM